jgi:hypothetical protein
MGWLFRWGVAHAAAFLSNLLRCFLCFILTLLFFCVSSFWFFDFQFCPWFYSLFLFADQDVAEYLYNGLPREWLTHYQVSSASKIVAVLQELRDHSNLEHRVDQALVALESRPA